MSNGLLTTSIIIPTYNQSWWLLEAAIISAASQVMYWDGKVEVILVDDGSQTPIEQFFAGIVTRFNDQYFSRYASDKQLSFIHVRHEENEGVAAALNSGIEQSNGEYIQWLSSDDLLCFDRSKLQIAHMVETESAISYCSYYDGIPQAGMVWPAAEYPSHDMFLARLKQNCFINACTIIWHRNIFGDVGLFDPEYRHCQDYNMILRCAEKYIFEPYDVPLVRRRRHGGQMSHLLNDESEFKVKAKEMQRLHDEFGVNNKVYVPQ